MKIHQKAFGGERKMLKGALHCHTTRSDGHGTPEEVIKYHHEHGYDFLAITDHGQYNFKNFAPDIPITIIPGFEFGIDNERGCENFHTVCLGQEKENGNPYEQDQIICGLTKTQEEHQKFLDEFHANNQLTFYCHPEWSGTPARSFEKLQGNFAFEIYNSGSHIMNDMDKDANYWDELLGHGKKIFGVAVDDGHSMSDHCNGWVMVNAENNVASILEALENGAFYSSTGPELYDVYIEDDVLVVECSPAAKIRCVCDNHRFRNIYPGGDKNQPGTITRGEFEYDNEPYVRVSVIDRNGKYAWSNPIFFDEIGKN